MKKSFLLIALLIVMTIFSTTAFAVSFSDLTSQHWAYEPIIEMANKGILIGYPDGTFLPDKSITRAEFAKILVVALELDTRGTDIEFDDVSKQHWAYNYIQTASKYLSAYRNNENSLIYLPDEKAVREDVAVAMVIASGLENAKYDLKTLDKFSDKNQISENFRKYVAIAVENGLMSGHANGTFEPKGYLTRAQVSQLIRNAEDVKEKVVVNDQVSTTEKVELPNFYYDLETGSIDLGENWNNYLFSYSTNNTIGKKYTPTKRILSYCEYGDDDGSRIYGNYAFIISKEDTSIYKTVKISDPFKSIKFNFENDNVDLGENWENYLYSYTYIKNAPHGTTYSPSQRVLKANSDDLDDVIKNGYRANKGFCNSDECFVTVYLLNNRDSFIYRPINLNNQDKYTRSGISSVMISGGYYADINLENTITINYLQRIASGIVKVTDENGKDVVSKTIINGDTNKIVLEGTFYDKKYLIQSIDIVGVNGKKYDDYEEVFLKTNMFKKTDYFSDIKFDAKTLQLDLGENWEKYQYTADNYPVYTPSQRFLTYEYNTAYSYDKNTGERKSNSYRMYKSSETLTSISEVDLKIMLKEDNSIYHIVHIENPFNISFIQSGSSIRAEVLRPLNTSWEFNKIVKMEYSVDDENWKNCEFKFLRRSFL